MPTGSNVLCGCGRFMQVKQHGIAVEELTEDGRDYKLWAADLYACVECGVEVIAGFGRGPIAEHFQPTYAEQRARLAPVYPGRCRAQPDADR
jgi:F0F1-type ATP synthase beta subunit